MSNRIKAMDWKKDQTLQYASKDGHVFNVRVTACPTGEVWNATVLEPIGNEKSKFMTTGPDDAYRQAAQSIEIFCLQRKVLSAERYWQKGHVGQKYNGPSGCPIFILWEDYLRCLKERKDISEHEIKLCKRSFYEAAFSLVHELVHFAHDPEEVLKAEAVWLHEVGQNLGESMDEAEKFWQAEGPPGTKPSRN